MEKPSNNHAILGLDSLEHTYSLRHIFYEKMVLRIFVSVNMCVYSDGDHMISIRTGIYQIGECPEFCNLRDEHPASAQIYKLSIT